MKHATNVLKVHFVEFNNVCVCGQNFMYTMGLHGITVHGIQTRLFCGHISDFTHCSWPGWSTLRRPEGKFDWV